MLLKSLAAAAALAGVLVGAPPASAATSPPPYLYWPPGNCPPGMFCGWPNTDHPPEGPTAPPSVVTATDWSGKVTVFNYFNYTTRNVDVTWSYSYLGSEYTGTYCSPPGDGHLYVPIYVTKVTFHSRPC
ncbi:hypothetical protein O7606_02245 [Micromonospora sp. WMMD882]|uniref:hypothetical protein n=1 Tax=Micromonospora sp. WMMD882 TaxID=3015151 RepID=UPI00248B0BEB|nr:hypothetical protein [Micromonospora sp. WMMD882]WBB80229.1 hypothetical protein O7606_02245 [Micromonospora sp. WMMD882]